MKFIRDFLKIRSNIIEILIVAILITFGINLITSSLFNLFKFEWKNELLFFIGISFVLISVGYFILKIFGRTNVEKRFSGFIVFDRKSNLPVSCDGYNYSEELNTILVAAFSENKALEHIWNRNSKPKKDKDSIIIEATEYYLIDELSTHLTDYFNLKNLDKQQLITFSRNDIPDILLSNRFLELFSKPMDQRGSFIKDINDDKSTGKIVMCYGAEGEIYKEFDLVLPKGSVVTKTQNGISIDTKRFIISFSVTYGLWGTVLPKGFENYYLGFKSYEDFYTNKIEVQISVHFKNRSIFSKKGWDYYEWIELFLKKFEKRFSKRYFFRSINWKQIYTQIIINKNHSST